MKVRKHSKRNDQGRNNLLVDENALKENYTLVAKKEQQQQLMMNLQTSLYIEQSRYVT